MTMRTPLWRFLNDRRATVSIDYGLIAVLLAAVLVTPFVSIEAFVNTTLQAISDAMRETN